VSQSTKNVKNNRYLLNYTDVENPDQSEDGSVNIITAQDDRVQQNIFEEETPAVVNKARPVT